MDGGRKRNGGRKYDEKRRENYGGKMEKNEGKREGIREHINQTGSTKCIPINYINLDVGKNSVPVSSTFIP